MLLALFRAAAAGDPPDKLALLELLRGHEFRELDARTSRLQREFENGEASDAPVRHAFESFASSDPRVAAAVDRWIEVMPGSYSAHAARGYHYTHVGWLARGNRPYSQTARGALVKMKRHFDTALASFDEALAINPKLTVAYERKMSMAAGLGARETLFEIFRQAAQSAPPSFVVRDRYLASLQPKWGGSLEDMRVVIGEILGQSPGDPELAPLAGYVAFASAEALAARGEGGALHLYDLALSRGEHRWFLCQRGRYHLFLGNRSLAIEDFDRALAMSPLYTCALRWRAHAYAVTGRHEPALRDYGLVLELDPLHPGALAGRGAVHEARGDDHAALADYGDALAFGAGDARNWFNLGRLQLDEGHDRDAAARSLRRAIELEPGRAQSWYHYSRALLGADDCAAVASLDTYLALCEKTGCDEDRTSWAGATAEELRRSARCASAPPGG